MRIIDWSSDVCSSDLHGNIRMTETPKSPKSKKSKKLQAFMCMSCNDPETSEIVFATSNVAARRIHTNSQGTDFADAQITRKKERSEERLSGKSVPVRVDLGGRRIIKKKNKVKKEQDK